MKKYYEESNFIGVLEPRAYYIPFDNKNDVFLPRRKSVSYIDLNGIWGITEYKSILEVEDNVYLNQTKNEIPVPSCVHIHGYDTLIRIFLSLYDHRTFLTKILVITIHVSLVTMATKRRICVLKG